MEPKKLGSGVVLPSALAAAGFGVFGLFLSTFLGDRRALLIGLGAAWLSFTLGRVLQHVDRPRGYGESARHLLTGASFGFAGFAFLNAVFLRGPGWPWTPWWALGAGFGFGLSRAHAPLLRHGHERGDAPRWLGVLHPKDLEALVVLATGYVLLGVCGFFILRAFGRAFGGSGQLLALAMAAYALHGARLLLRFASEERAGAGKGVVHFLKANALQLGIVALLLVAYAVFRERLSVAVPHFPLIEYGLGIALFGFVLARLRSRLRRDGSALATASEARDHARVVAQLREADHDAVARPVTRFIESGHGKSEYADALLHALPEDDARRAAAAAALQSHREPPRAPPLDLRWALAAGGVTALGLGLAGLTLGLRVLHADMPFPFVVALLFLAFAVYAQQDVARAHHRPWLAFAIAAIGTAILFLGFLLFAGSVGRVALVPGAVWLVVGVIALVMLGVPAQAAWRHAKLAAKGQLVDARRKAPPLEHEQETQKMRKRAATMTLAAFVVLLPVPWLAGWLAERGFAPADFPPFLGDVLAVAVWVVTAFGGGALVRFYGLARGRADLLAREKEKRERRLALHKAIMNDIERTSP